MLVLRVLLLPLASAAAAWEGEKGKTSRSVPHLIKDGGIASCCRNPHLLEKFVTNRILVFQTEIRAAKDNPEKTKRLMLMEAQALGTPHLEKC